MTYIIDHNNLGYFGGGAGCSCKSCGSETQNLSSAAVLAPLFTMEGASLGLGIFGTGQSLVTSGKLSCEATTVNYVHEKTPPTQNFVKCERKFSISASQPPKTSPSVLLRPGPTLVLGDQTFWFLLSFQYNGNDLRNIAIVVLENESSRMITSEFSIRFDGQPYSVPLDPVAHVVFQIKGRWDPTGLGIDSFRGELYVRADGRVRLWIKSEQSWVRANQFSLDCPPVAPVPMPKQLP